MVKTLGTLPEDIHKLLDGSDLSSSIERFKDDIGRLMLDRFKNDDRSSSLRMSNIGRPNRQLWYELNGYEGEKLSGQTKFKFLYGHLIETLVLFLAEAAGHEVTRLQEEVNVDGVLGHLDAVIDGVLVDLKSCSSYSFNKFRTATVFEDDPFGYVGQLAGYSKATNLPAAWVAIDKVTGDICILDLPTERVVSYDVSERIREVRTAIAGKDEPARCYEPVPYQKSGNQKLPVGCSYCAFKGHCWRDANGGTGLRTYIYSTGPVYLTKVVKEPRVQQETYTTEELNFTPKE